MKMNRRDFIKAGTGAFFVSTASISALPVVSGAPAGKLSLVWPREGASVSQLHTFQSLLSCSDDSEGACGADGTGKSPITAAEMQVGMNYYINATMSIS